LREWLPKGDAMPLFLKTSKTSLWMAGKDIIALCEFLGAAFRRRGVASNDLKIHLAVTAVPCNNTP
jgi:hypothetical protein